MHLRSFGFGVCRAEAIYQKPGQTRDDGILLKAGEAEGGPGWKG